MATWFSWICNSCGYKYVGAGIPSALMSGPTTPMVCTHCHELSDYLLPIFSQENDPSRCDHCRKKGLIEWDYKKRTCPKPGCAGHLIKDNYGDIIMAD